MENAIPSAGYVILSYLLSQTKNNVVITTNFDHLTEDAINYYDGFLYNMVRIMVGTLLRIAQGKIPEDGIPAILEAKDRSKAGPTARACGLYLNRVFYEEDL